MQAESGTFASQPGNPAQIAIAFLMELGSEIEPFTKAGIGLLKEHEVFIALCAGRPFVDPPIKTVADAATYTLLLKQYELANAAVTALLQHDYVVCATLIRSIFEVNTFLMQLDHHPEDAEDFLMLSEVCCKPEVDWSKHGVSRTKREALEKKFSIRKLLRELYAGTDNVAQRVKAEGFYQELCNATHPSLEAASFFYRAGAPPTREYSSVGIRRTLIQLWGVLNSAVEHVCGALYRDRGLLEECYKRRGEMYSCHVEATDWHANNSDAGPAVTRNQELQVVWINGRPTVACLAGAI